MRALLAVAALALTSAQEIIAADQGAGGSTATTHKSYASAAPLSQAQYTQSMYATSGAGSGTIWIMMGTVMLGYLCLVIIMSSACFYRPVAGHQQPFVRFQEMTDQEDHLRKRFVADLDEVWRKAFVGKVYTLLVIQIAITLLVSFAMMTFGGYEFYIWSLTEGAWTRMAALLLTFVLIITLMCFKNAYPWNLVMLFAFTLVMSYTIGTICTAYAAAGMMVVVIEAFAITSLIFIALTIFAMKSGIDFSFLGLILPILLFTFIIWGFFAMIAFPSFAMSQVYALVGTIIFCLYVLYDTHAICTYLSYDDYVLGAINLYLDFINLFLFILQGLAGMRRD